MTTDALTTSAVIQNAHAAFLAGRSALPGTRAAWLEAVAAGLEAHDAELIELAGKETHLPEARLTGELKRTVFQLRLLASELAAGAFVDATIDHADSAWGMGPRPDIRRMNVPLGVVGVFGASNFPFAFSVMGGDSASALAAGCSVVHKIHSGHLQLGLRTSEIVTAALAAAGAPAGLFATVVGREAAEALVDHSLVKAIGFTGSTAGGRALFNRAAARPEPIPFFGELGSINPVVVTEAAWAARKETILTEYAQSFTMGMGQFCTKPGLLFAPVGDTVEVRRIMADTLEGVSLTPLLTPGLHDGFQASVATLSSDPDVSVLVQGTDAEIPTPTVLLTSLDAVTRKPELLETEMFGPATLIISYEAGANLAAVAERLEGQLTTTVHGEAGEDVTDLVCALAEKSGRVLWNGWPTGVTVSYAQHHGGPYPATTAAAATSVGTSAVVRFMRPVAYQDFPEEQLPAPLRESNPWAIQRRVDGVWEGPNTGKAAS